MAFFSLAQDSPRSLTDCGLRCYPTCSLQRSFRGDSLSEVSSRATTTTTIASHRYGRPPHTASWKRGASAAVAAALRGARRSLCCFCCCRLDPSAGAAEGPADYLRCFMFYRSVCIEFPYGDVLGRPKHTAFSKRFCLRSRNPRSCSSKDTSAIFCFWEWFLGVFVQDIWCMLFYWEKGASVFGIR